MWARDLPATAVAVLDTGVMHTHPDLVGQVCGSWSFTYCNTAGPGGNPAYPIYSSLIDFDAHPDWNPGAGCTAAPTTQYHAHGTHVAGIIAARLSGGRVVGVAPQSCVAAYKVFDRYRYTADDGTPVDKTAAFDGPLFAAITHAASTGVPVISMSLGSHVSAGDGNASWKAWNRVAKYANRQGAVLVASAGNSEFNLNGALAHLPGDIPTMVNTSATGSNNLVRSAGAYTAAPGSDVLAYYSNYGAAVDVAAPGGDCGPDPATCLAQHLILSTGIRETGGPAAGMPVYIFFAGTSMATPHVSAVAALVRAQHPAWTPGDVRAWLKETAEPLGDRQAFGHGMIDASAATR